MQKKLAGLLITILISLMFLGSSNQSLAATSTYSSVYTVANGTKAYDIVVTRGGLPQVVTTIPVRHINDATIPVYLDPSGAYVAYIADHDGVAGTDLRVYDLKQRTEKMLARGRIGGATWSPDGKRLVYFTAPHEGKAANVRVVALGSDPTDAAFVPGVTQILGWDQDQVYLVASQPTQGFDARKVSRLNLTSGAVTDLLLSDEESAEYLSNFAWISPKDGSPLIGYVVSDTLVGAAERNNYLALADLQGQIVRLLPASTDRIIGWSWTERLDGVAVMIGNVHGQNNGIWTMDRDGSNRRRVTQEINTDFELRGWDGQNLRFYSPVYGLHQTSLRQPVMPGANMIGPDATILGACCATVNLTVPYIHQVFDTPTVNSDGKPYPNGFAMVGWGKTDGGKQDACGPTSAVMVAARLGLMWSSTTVIPEQTNNGQTVPAHATQYGEWVPWQFSAPATGFNFNKWDYDASQSRFGQGAHGHMVIAKSGSTWAALTDFMVQSGGTSLKYNTWDSSTMTGSAWARAELDAGHAIIASVEYNPGWGHLTVIKGYTDNETGSFFILNDPYGHYTGGVWGQYKGANAQMAWNSMGVKWMRSFYKQ